MKRVGHTTNQSGERVTLLEAMADYASVQKAYNKARKCKRYRKDVLIFTKDKEGNLEKVRDDILNLSYEPSEYHYFKVFEPKERQIMALPFYDRVVQHAINNVLEPIFDKRFISQSYACRKGKGMHAASDTLQNWLYEWQKFHTDEPLYAIKADIHHYFQSIDHGILKAEIRKVIKDAGVLALLDKIIDHNGNMPEGVGIPVGNLTSQLFANIYLDKLDKYVKHTLGAKQYIRYMDDFIILSPDKDELRRWLADIEVFLRGEYHYFKVFEPKERQIMALPFYDRVVQHAINNVLEPIFDKRFISQSYACRKGKGMHAASDTLQNWLYEWQKFHTDEPLYAIKADIHHYFQSIDHGILKAEIRKVIKDAGVLALLDKIIDHNGNMPEGVGIPVGNLTSQLFANIYLDKLDKYVKHTLGAKQYIRYMDDFIILSPDKDELRRWLADIEVFLRDELRLALNPKTAILAAKNGVDFVGYKHRATHRKVRPDSIKRVKRTIKKCESGKITKEQLQKSIQSWTGHAGHADSYHLRKKIKTLADTAIQKAA